MKKSLVKVIISAVIFAGVIFTKDIYAATLSVDSGKPRESFHDFLNGEVRYNSLQINFPERAEVLFSKAELLAKERYEKLKIQEKNLQHITEEEQS